MYSFYKQFIMSKAPIDIMMESVDWIKTDYQPTGEEKLPYVTHEGVLDIAGFKLRCYQLSTGDRVLDGGDVSNFFGIDSPNTF